MQSEWKIPWSGKSHTFTEEEISFVADFMRTAGTFTQGEYLGKFQRKLKSYLGIEEDQVFAVTSGTAALELSAMLIHLEEGDEVIVPAHTFCASALPFLRRKAKIVWADIDPDTWVIDYEDVAGKVNSRTKALVLVHLYGMPADVDSFISMASGRNLYVIEDAAQAMGALYKGKRIGTLGDLGIFSFHAQKNISTFGEGGALFVKDPSIARKVPGLRSFGNRQFPDKELYWKPAMINVESIIDWELPHKFTISEIQCAIGYKLLDRLDDLNGLRKRRYWTFRERLADFPELRFQKFNKGVDSSYHLMAAKYEGQKHGIKAERDDLIKLLAFEYGIQAIVQYYPLYRYDLFKKWGLGDATCPNTDDFFDNMLSFPFHVWMSDDDFSYMIESTRMALKRLREKR